MPSHLEQLLSILNSKENLNDEFSDLELQHLYALADQVKSEDFAVVAKEIMKWIDLFRDSPQQRFGKEILAEYFNALEQSAKQLSAAGEIALLPQDSADKSTSQTFSSALVLANTNLYSPVDRCKILNRSDIPLTLTRAADAFRRRVEIVDSVLEVGFDVLHRIDAEKFQLWVGDFLKANEGNQEPEVVRDVLRALLNVENLHSDLLQWIMKISSDAALLEQWPYVVALSDKLLCRLSLRKWSALNRRRNTLLAHLGLMVEREYFDADHLVTWMQNALKEFGSGVQHVLNLKFDSDEEKAAEWNSIAVRTELQRLAELYQPIMIICGETLTRPDGANTMAMALFGLIGKSRDEWEEQILKQAEQVVLRIFLMDLKNGKKPVDTIRTLTFGDKIAFNLACSELDLVSQAFDSVSQRNKVVKMLSYYYASYRHVAYLGMEIASRYRALKRILHEDFLRNILTAEDWKSLENTDLLRDLGSLLTAARKFLDHRRALNMSLEEMLASEIEFVAEARTRRMAILRGL